MWGEGDGSIAGSLGSGLALLVDWDYVAVFPPGGEDTVGETKLKEGEQCVQKGGREVFDHTVGHSIRADSNFGFGDGVDSSLEFGEGDRGVEGLRVIS